MNKEERAILYGIAIGDGHISYRTRLKDGKYRYEQAELIVGHSVKQEQYIQHKADLLHKIFGGKRPKVSVVYHNVNSTIYEGRRIAKTNPYFRQMHKILYKENKQKFINQEVLDKLDEMSLALWFMDDGSVSYNTNKQNNVTSLSLRICTQFSEEEGQLVCNWLKEKYNIVFKYYKAKDRYDIGCNTKEAIEFIDLIFDHLHNSMFYKIKPLARLIIRKSARHLHFDVGEDIVQSVKNKINSVGE